MFSPDDTIVAISTPLGHGGIGVVRISGTDAGEIARRLLPRTPALEPRRATLSSVVNPSVGERGFDRVLATSFPAPDSYTGEDVVEISAHGSPVLLRQIISAAVSEGARLAEPGEFTLRAFLHGRVDLVQAEAVGDLVNAVTPLQARAAFDQLEGTVTARIAEIERLLFDLVARLEASVDFPDEGYHFVDPQVVSTEIQGLVDRIAALLVDARRGRLLREGGQVVILGKPNVGKSTLFNQLLGTPRAIVTRVAGTTRDLLTETVDLDGIPVTLVDTAGIRPTDDAIETEGVERARAAIGVARMVVLVLDRSRPLDDEDLSLLQETAALQRVVVVNKIDCPASWAVDRLAHDDAGRSMPESVVSVSLLEGHPTQAQTVRRAVTAALLAGEDLRDPPAVTNVRHIDLLDSAQVAMRRAAAAASAALPEEIVLADLGEAQHALGEVTGARTPEDVLNRIFSEFCIGK